SERDLVKVEIERPDTDLASGSSLCSSLICSILTFLVGPAFDPGKKIFRTHEADACSTFFEGPGHFCRAVGVHIESKSRVGGFIRLDRTCRCCRKFLLSECPIELIFRREGYGSRVSVNHDEVAVLKTPSDPLYAGYCRNIALPGQDESVRCPASAFRDDRRRRRIGKFY